MKINTKDLTLNQALDLVDGEITRVIDDGMFLFEWR